MVVRVANQAQRSQAIRVAIATDSPRIADVARAHGHEAIMTRADHASGTERLAEAITLMELAEDTIVVNVQGDEPEIPPALIDALVQKPLQYLHVSLWDFYKKARRGADTERTRIEQLHQHIGGKLPLIGVGNLYTASQAAEALATGWAEFIALGKTLLINPHWAELTEQGRDDDIQTEIDPERAESYRLPARMLGLTLQGTQAWLPPVKGMERKILDI